MAITDVSTALAVNLVARWVLRHDGETGVPDGEQAREALATICDQAHRKLSAGLDGGQVRRSWQGRGLGARCSCDGDPIECGHEAVRGQAEAELERVREESAAVEAALREERARLIAFASAVYPAVICANHPAAPGVPLIYVDTPAGQIAWRLAGRDLTVLGHVRRVEPGSAGEPVWDGHSAQEAHERLARLTAAEAGARRRGCAGEDGAGGCGHQVALTRAHAELAALRAENERLQRALAAARDEARAAQDAADRAYAARARVERELARLREGSPGDGSGAGAV